MEIDASQRLDELPIFPLATVLFPGALLPLHIFEPRYKEMVSFAIDHGGMFGLSYRDDAAIGRETIPEIDSVGCVAKINAVMPLEEGKMNLISRGVIRYRVLGFRQVSPFVVSTVETFTDDLEPGEDLARLFVEVVELCKDFLSTAARALDEPGIAEPSPLPGDPEALSLLIASLLPLENDSKQNMLEMRSTRLRLSRLRPHITAFLTDYKRQIRMKELSKGNGHGKLDQ